MEETYNSAIWVTGVILIIWGGIAAYLLYLGRELKKVSLEDNSES